MDHGVDHGTYLIVEQLCEIYLTEAAISFISELSRAKRTQRSTMGKKMW